MNHIESVLKEFDDEFASRDPEFSECFADVGDIIGTRDVKNFITQKHLEYLKAENVRLEDCFREYEIDDNDNPVDEEGRLYESYNEAIQDQIDFNNKQIKLIENK